MKVTQDHHRRGGDRVRFDDGRHGRRAALHEAGWSGDGSTTQTAQPSYTVTLTAAQLAELMNGSRAATTGGAHARQTQQHSRQTRQHAKAARHQTRSHAAVAARSASASGSGGTHHYEAT